jgi:hypothetical protein
MGAVGAIPSAQPRKRIKVNHDDLPPVEDKTSTPNGDMRSINRASVEMQNISRYKRMEEYFKEQPRERVKIRKELGEQVVRINGYPFQIQAGEWVKVPVDVAEILHDAELA